MKMTQHSRALDKIYKRRDRYEIPDWQREEVWTASKKRKLIDSILRGWKLPKFYFLKTGSNPEEFEVVDGQQRLQAIFEFFDNELALTGKAVEEFGGATYEELPEELSDGFDDFEIEYDQIVDASDQELKEFFQRLQEGLPLTSSEKLNSVHSKLRDYCKELADESFFSEKTAVSPRRYGHFDIVAKVAALEIDGLDSGLRYEDIKEVFEANKSFSRRSNIGKRIAATFDTLDKIFPKKDSRLRNRTIVQAIATLVAKIVAENGVQGKETALRKFFEHFLTELGKQVELGHEATDTDYLTFQRTVNANVKSGPKTRQQILLRKLLAFDPTMADLFGPAVFAESGISGNVRARGETIAGLITQVNAEHAGNTGKDLFKMTAKTMTALLSIREPINDLDEYKSFIDDLYFLFHEGPGSRLTKRPESFSDVNELRTELRHDLDHGKSGKVARKRRSVSATFKKYGGTASPITLAPERFPMVQVAVLTALERDLRAMLPKGSGARIPAKGTNGA